MERPRAQAAEREKPINPKTMRFRPFAVLEPVMSERHLDIDIRLDRLRTVAVLPCVEAACKGVGVPSHGLQFVRHTGAGGFILSSAIGDDSSIRCHSSRPVHHSICWDADVAR